MKLTQKKIQTFQSYVFSWWEKNKRDLPWRHTRDPYLILVSELMLQQTQVSRVIEKYQEFITKYPDVYSLAEATDGDIIRLWKGLGYNRRALYLRRIALEIVNNYKGVFPKLDTQLVQLPGVGTYTARAICVFAYEQDVAAVDVNIRKIITHHFFDDVVRADKVIEETASKLVPKGRSWEWHQALMDYGALELPNLYKQKGLLTKKQKNKIKITFRDTKRFARGRIIDELRSHPWNKELLVETMVKKFGKSSDFYTELLYDLTKEKLIIEVNGLMSLP